MSQRLGWKKLLLVCLVSGAHLALLAAFASDSGNITNSDLAQDRRLSITLITAAEISQTAANEPFQRIVSPNKSYSNRLDIQASAIPATQPLILLDSRRFPRLGRPDLYLDADALDTTAVPPDGFQQILEQRLPYDIESVVLEFLIDNEGNTVAVNCLEGDCNLKLQGDISKLRELTFIPAIKGSAAVASRKVIQVDPKPKSNQ